MEVDGEIGAFPCLGGKPEESEKKRRTCLSGLCRQVDIIYADNGRCSTSVVGGCPSILRPVKTEVHGQGYAQRLPGGDRENLAIEIPYVGTRFAWLLIAIPNDREKIEDLAIGDGTD